MGAKRKKGHSGRPGSPRIVNRRARHDYHILATVECGMELTGSEVKSLRAGKITLDDAHARVRDGQAFLVGAHIAEYPDAPANMQHKPDRDRRLLLHRRQIDELAEHVKQKGRTIVPLVVYFKRGWAKVELGLAVGKRQHDKREDIRKRETQRDIEREMRRRR
ncbi:MAG: SsrA-binding protein SmpB [Phycisphaerae bacterium]